MQLAMITAQQVIVLFILIFAGFICQVGSGKHRRKEVIF